MNSDQEEESAILHGETVDKQMGFVLILKDFPVLLSKSQTPSIKDKKEKAVSAMLQRLQQAQGIKMDEKTLAKKISRMKTEVKKKCDANQTGNKELKLRPWEEEMFDLMGAESNPSLAKIQGAVSFGIKMKPKVVGNTSRNAEFSARGQEGAALAVVPYREKLSAPLALPALDRDQEQISHSGEGSTVTSRPSRPQGLMKRKTGEEIMTRAETEETKLLSNAQLQRLVLLEQLAVLKLKRQRFEDSTPVGTFIVSSQNEIIPSFD